MSSVQPNNVFKNTGLLAIKLASIVCQP